MADEVIDALRGSELFRSCSDKLLARLRDIGKEIAFDAGAELVGEGEDAGRFFVLLEGSADVVIKGVTRSTLGSGDAFGEIALLDGGPRSASVVATSPVRTFSLASWNFKPFLSDHEVMAGAIALLCRRLRSAEALIHD